MDEHIVLMLDFGLHVCILVYQKQMLWNSISMFSLFCYGNIWFLIDSLSFVSAGIK